MAGIKAAEVLSRMAWIRLDSVLDQLPIFRRRNDIGLRREFADYCCNDFQCDQ